MGADPKRAEKSEQEDYRALRSARQSLTGKHERVNRACKRHTASGHSPRCTLREEETLALRPSLLRSFLFGGTSDKDRRLAADLTPPSRPTPRSRRPSHTCPLP